MSGLHTYKLVALKIRQHTLALQVANKLRKAGHVGIQVTGYVDHSGARLVPHDFILHDVYVLVRSRGHIATKGELLFMRQYPAYMQLGASNIANLLVHMDAARASKYIMRVEHWSTVGNGD